MSSLVMEVILRAGHSPSQLTRNCLRNMNTVPLAILFSVLADALGAERG